MLPTDWYTTLILACCLTLCECTKGGLRHRAFITGLSLKVFASSSICGGSDQKMSFRMYCKSHLLTLKVLRMSLVVKDDMLSLIRYSYGSN